MNLPNHDSCSNGADGGTSTVPPTYENVRLGELACMALHNHVIVEKILVYLDHSSMKALRAVNCCLKDIVTEYKAFVDRSNILFVKLDTTTLAPVLSTKCYGAANFPWKSVSLRLCKYWTKDDITSIAFLIPRVLSLELTVLGTDVFEHVNGGPQLQECISLLEESVSIKELTLDAVLLGMSPIEFNEFEGILQNSKIKRNLSQLESLMIRNSGITHEKYRMRSTVGFANIFKRLVELPSKLLKFSFQRILLEMNFDDNGEARTEGSALIGQTIVSLLKKHKEWLEDVSFDELVLESPSFAYTSFPALKNLSLDVIGEDLSRVAKFISLQPRLQRLEVMFKGSETSRRKLEAALQKQVPNLRELELTWNLPPLTDILQELNNHLEPRRLFSFDFLKSAGKLKKVKIFQCARNANCFFEEERGRRDPRSSLGTLLSLLNDTICEISFGGTVWGDFTGDSPGNTIESLGRFRNLSVLDLVQCPNAINDEVLAFICSHMTHLTHFGFSHCEQLTDFGLTGKRENAILAHGVKSLKGLTTLRIISCKQLTWNGLHNSISLPYLQELTLIPAQNQRPFSEFFYMQLLSQLPSMETLTICGTQSVALENLEAGLKRRFPRFKKLVFMKALDVVMNSGNSTDDEEDYDNWNQDWNDDMYDDYEDFGFEMDKYY